VKLCDHKDVDFVELLEDAVARTVGDAEEQFVEDMVDRYGEWGIEMFISDKQIDWLHRIADRSLDDYGD